MKVRHLILLVVLCSGLGACVSTVTPMVFEPESFSSLLERRQFTQARSMLYGGAGMQLPQGQRQAYADQLNTAAGLYAQDIIASAGEQEQLKQWYQAGQLLEEGLDALPRNTDLQSAYAEFSNSRKAYVDEVKHKLRLHRSGLLPEEIDLTRLLSEVDPRDERLRNKLYDMEQEAASLVIFLTPLAQQAFADGRYKEARKYDRQILQLGESAPSRVRIAAVDKKLNQQARRRVQSRKKADKKKRDKLWSDYEKALEIADFQQAQAALERLGSLGFAGPAAEQERGRLNELIDKKCTALIAEGKKFYTRGKLNAAIDRWQQALSLTPDNQELVARIKRAETFQANYQRLSR